MPTLKTGLGNYDIGGKLRTLRLKKRMGLVELGQHTGLSPALLSKIERGRLFPTLPTLLLRLSMALTRPMLRLLKARPKPTLSSPKVQSLQCQC